MLLPIEKVLSEADVYRATLGRRRPDEDGARCRSDEQHGEHHSAS